MLDTLKLLCDTTPSADRAILDTMQLLGDTSLGTTRARTTRHTSSARATADIINRYNTKARHHNQVAEKNAKDAQRRLAKEIRRHNDQVKPYNQKLLRSHPATSTSTSDISSGPGFGNDTDSGS